VNDSRSAQRDQQLLEQLDPETARMLFPDKFPQRLRVTLQYPSLDSATADKAVTALARAESCEDAPAGQSSATYTLEEAEALHDLFALVDSEFGSAAVAVRINGQTLPMARELWLPLFWSLRS